MRSGRSACSKCFGTQFLRVLGLRSVPLYNSILFRLIRLLPGKYSLPYVEMCSSPRSPRTGASSATECGRPATTSNKRSLALPLSPPPSNLSPNTSNGLCAPCFRSPHHSDRPPLLQTTSIRHSASSWADLVRPSPALSICSSRPRIALQTRQ